MPINKYSIDHSPSSKDKDRYKLNISGTQEDIEKLADKLGNISSRPFPSPDEDYNFSLFLYGLDKKKKKNLTRQLHKIVKPPAAKNSTPEGDGQKKKPFGIEERFNKLKPGYVFEKFVVGTNTRFTYAACKAVAENPGKNYNPLFIYGGVGLGKTHLMQSIGNYAREHFPEMTVVYITTQEFINEIIDAIEAGKIKDVREKYKEVDILLIDDIQFLQQSESTQEEFFLIFNAMHDVGKQIVVTSDKPPKELVTLEDRLKSRFEWGLTTDIKRPNFETRKAIFKKKATEAGIEVNDDIVNYISERLTSNIRELEGILNRISAYMELSGEEINLELIKDIIKNILPAEQDPEEKEEREKEAEPDTSSSPPPPPSPQQVQPFPQAQYPPPPPQAPGRHTANVCSYCGMNLIFIPQYQRWYCSNCGRYQDPVPTPSPGPAQPPPPVPASGRSCKKCSRPLRYISQYDRFYCSFCKEYASEEIASPPQSQTPPPEPEEKKIKEPQKSSPSKQKPVTETKKEETKEPPEEKEIESFENRVIGEEKKDIRKITAGYFIPAKAQKVANKLVDKLNKLATHKKFNFYIKPLFTHYYNPEENVNFEKVAHMAKNNEIDIALCMEPGEDAGIKADKFRIDLGKAMSKASVPFEVLSCSEIKESDALNLMLDIAICAKKKENKK